MPFTFLQIKSLVSGAIIMMVLGALYVFGAISPYINSYLHYQSDSIATLNTLNLVLTCSIVCLNIGMLLGNAKLINFNPKIKSFIAIFGISLTMLALSFCRSYLGYLFLYGFSFGLFMGYGYLAPMQNCFRHLPKNKGLCSGVCIMGFGFGALIFNLILLQIINPNNEKFDPQTHLFEQQIANNVPLAFQVIAGVYFVLGSIGCLLMNLKKQKVTSSQLLSQQQLILEQNKQKEPIIQMNLKQFVQKKAYFLIINIACTIPFGMFVAFSYKEFGLTQINDDRFLTVLGSLAGISNGASRMIMGSLMDCVSSRKILITISITSLICSVSINWAVQSKPIYFVLIIVAYFFYGANFAVYPVQTVRIFGQKKGNAYYWLVYMGFTMGNNQYMQVQQFRIQFIQYQQINLVMRDLSIHLQYFPFYQQLVYQYHQLLNTNIIKMKFNRVPKKKILIKENKIIKFVNDLLLFMNYFPTFQQNMYKLGLLKEQLLRLNYVHTIEEVKNQNTQIINSLKNKLKQNNKKINQLQIDWKNNKNQTQEQINTLQIERDELLLINEKLVQSNEKLATQLRESQLIIDKANKELAILSKEKEDRDKKHQRQIDNLKLMHTQELYILRKKDKK